MTLAVLTASRNTIKTLLFTKEMLFSWRYELNFYACVAQLHKIWSSKILYVDFPERRKIWKKREV
jgi:hypothetical protein